MKQFYTVLTITLFFFTLFFFSEEKTTVGQSDKNIQNNSLLEKVNLLEKKMGEMKAKSELNSSNVSYLSEFSPPVGTVMAYAGEWPPFKDNSRTEKYSAEEMWEKGWVLCAGQKFDKEQYKELFRVLGKDQVPDYKKKFIRGSENNSNVGTPIGKDQIDEYDLDESGHHVHHLPAFTGCIGRLPPEVIPVERYSIQFNGNQWGDNGGVGPNGDYHLEVTKNILKGLGGNILAGQNNTIDEGQHAHRLGGTTIDKEAEGKHTHTIPAKPIIPSSIHAHYIIKVKSKIE